MASKPTDAHRETATRVAMECVERSRDQQQPWESLIEVLVRNFALAISEARAQERERCAKICDTRSAEAKAIFKHASPEYWELDCQDAKCLESVAHDNRWIQENFDGWEEAAELAKKIREGQE